MTYNEEDSRGMDPEELLECTVCGRIYSGAVTAEGDVLPAGTDGTCSCGNDEFTIVPDE